MGSVFAGPLPTPGYPAHMQTTDEKEMVEGVIEWQFILSHVHSLQVCRRDCSNYAITFVKIKHPSVPGVFYTRSAAYFSSISSSLGASPLAESAASNEISTFLRPFGLPTAAFASVWAVATGSPPTWPASIS